MSEPQRTEPLAGSTIHKDEAGRPFKPVEEETPASLGKFEDPYINIS